MVIFIHRYDYQGLSENPDDIGRTQIIIAKHRNGAIADIDMKFRADEVRFVDLSDSLVNQADSMGVESAMNSDFISGGDFASGSDFDSVPFE
jgi:replicative DNA helicase